MSCYIIDASVAAKWYFNEDQTDLARRILVTIKSFHAPDFFLIEMDNIFCKRIKKKEMTRRDTNQARKMLSNLPVKLYPFTHFQDSAFSMAVRTGISIYDSLYLTLAVSLDGMLITADKRLFKTIHKGPLGNNIIWIENAV